MDKILHFGDFCSDLVAELDRVLSPAVASASSDLSVVIATVGAFMTNEREVPPIVISFDSYRKDARTYVHGSEQLMSPAALLAYESRSSPVNTDENAVSMVYRLYDNLVEDRAKIPKLAEVIEFFVGRLRRLTKMD
ncbi:Hypothetical Protein FCC1311_061102 [Hondaea fermentalgiana]|uniref:Uncharacterized protein n=1 Tax=Hondaea fermentalgiana TaxID=2315210 RepID=A0A2R5GG94_9STRA|nr:Hypothetical Protein FCC1311_061102 [Hondaea fermentalgiana]|eukprot:GBG29890.1 Hypothetical Protein FCC1311_061102 [Hondaea fermentalgiana]